MIKNAIEAARLLVVSSDPSILRPLWSLGESNGWQLEIAVDPWDAIERTQSTARFDLLLLDLLQGNGDGLHCLRWLHRIRPSMAIVVLGHSDDLGRKREALRMGARDYLTRPLDDRQLEMAIQSNIYAADAVIEPEITSDDVEPVSHHSFFIGVSPVMRRLRAQAALLAEASVPVLILGEDGSGKETTARLIHTLSVRSGFEFAKVNCAALPADLLEGELFGGDRKGAGPVARTKTGKIELCAKGTIFLDEITEMPQSLQSKLVEVLRNKQFTRPGSYEIVEADVRVLAASSIKLERAVSEFGLSEELYHELSKYTLHVPSLRDRKEELSFLSRHFMHRLAKHYGLAAREFSPAIIEQWQAYHWPGNLRELEHCVKRYLMVGDGELASGACQIGTGFGFQEFALDRSGEGKQAASISNRFRTAGATSKSLRSLVQSVKAEAERTAIAVALEKTGWNRKAAARLLKVSYRTVLYKIEQYQMTASDPSPLRMVSGFRETEN
jgi:two-component system, NtrC family, response regulator AtoC